MVLSPELKDRAIFRNRTIALEIERLAKKYDEDSSQENQDFRQWVMLAKETPHFVAKRLSDIWNIQVSIERARAIIENVNFGKKEVVRYPTATFKDVDDSGLAVSLHWVTDEEAKRDVPFEFCPEWFEFPAVVLWPWSTRPVEISTPYGVLPAIVIGADGGVYNFSHFYFFNRYSQGVKFEEVFRYMQEDGASTQKVLQDLGLDLNKIFRITVFPKKSDSRHLPLNENDYTKVENILSQIKDGRFVIVR